MIPNNTPAAEIINPTENAAANLSRQQIETLLGEIKTGTQDLATLKARLTRAQTRLAQTIEKRLQEKSAEIAAKGKTIEDWSIANREKEFDGKDKKTLKLLHGELKFREGKSRCEIIADWTVEKCIDALNKFRKLKNVYLRRPPAELDKAQMIKDYDANRIDADTLAKFGIKIEKAESFSIKLA